MRDLLRIVFIVCVLLVVAAMGVMPLLAMAFPQLGSWVPSGLLYSQHVKVQADADDWSPPGIHPVFYMFFALLLAILAIRLAMRESSRSRARKDEDERRIMQELHAGLTRLEERVESLEDVLVKVAKHGSPKTEDRNPKTH